MPDARADERTPLLSNPRAGADNGDGTTSTTGQEGTLAGYAERVIRAVHSDVNAPVAAALADVEAGPGLELAVLLHAHLHLQDKRHGQNPETVLDQLAWERRDRQIADRLDDEIERLLDNGGSSASEGDAVEVFWRRHKVAEGGVKLSALDLLAMPVDNEPSVHLSHPLIPLVLHQSWKGGMRSEDHARGVVGTAQTWISSRRLHVWHFVAALNLWCMTLSIAIRTQRWIGPPDQGPLVTGAGRPTALEITWLIFVFGLLVQTVPRGFRWLPIPSILAACLALFPSARAYTYPTLLLSIPCLTISLIRPSPPSIAYLSPSLIPYSTRLFESLRRSVRGWALVIPLLLVLFGCFSLSMNGDLSRGFFVLAFTSSQPPAEPGVAPFEARVIICLTLVMLVYLALVLSLSSSGASPRERYRAGAWEKEHGERIARLARQAWIRGSRWLAGDTSTQGHGESRGSDPPALPIPLNLVLVPFDIAVVCARLRASGSDNPSYSVDDTIGRARFVLASGLAGCLCWPMWLIERWLSRERS